MRINLKDAYGNWVEDGTEVEVRVENKEGKEASSPLKGATANGTVLIEDITTTLNDDFVLKVITNGANPYEIEIDVTPLELELTTTHSAIDLSPASGNLDTAIVTLQTNATNGAKVVWTVSDYLYGANEPQVSESTVLLGEAFVPLGAMERFQGKCYVTATVGARIAVLDNIEFFRNTTGYGSNNVKIGHYVLCGTQSEDNVETLDINWELSWTQGSHTFDVLRRALTAVDVVGPPGVTTSISLTPEAQQLIRLLQVVNGEINFDPSGGATFSIKSKGAFTGTFSEDNYLEGLEISIYAVVDFVIPVVEHTTLDGLIDVVCSFFGGDPTTPGGIVASVAGGLAIVGDIGAMLKNGNRAVGFSNQQVNLAETGFAAFGLATELAVGVGEAPDVPISVARAIAAHMPHAAFTDIVMRIINRAMANTNQLVDFGEFLLRATKTSVATAISKTVFKTEEVVLTASRAHKGFPDEYFKTFEIVRTTGRVLAEGPVLSYTRVVSKIADAPFTSALGKARAALKAASASARRAAFVGLYDAVARGIDEGTIEKILKNGLYKNYPTGQGNRAIRNISTNYTQVDLFTDLGQVARNTPQGSGLGSLLRSLHNRGTGRSGFRYELEVAAHFSRQSNYSLKFVSHKIKNLFGKTDLDVVLEDAAGNAIAVQAKRSHSAWGSGKKVSNWTQKAHVGPPPSSNMWWVSPDGVPAQPSRAWNAFQTVKARFAEIQVSVLKIDLPFK